MAADSTTPTQPIPLSRVVATGGLQRELVLVIGMHVAELLSDAHRRGVYGHDLSLDTILVAEDGSVSIVDPPAGGGLSPADDLHQLGLLLARISQARLPLPARMLASSRMSRWFADAGHVVAAFSRRLATFDVPGLTRFLGRLIHGDAPVPRPRRRSLPATIATVVVVVFAVAAGAGGMAYLTGAYNVVLNRATVASVRIELSVPVEWDSAIPVSLVLTPLADGEQRHADALSLLLSRSFARDTGRSVVYSTSIEYLPVGLYRLRLSVGESSLHRDVLLHSIAHNDGLRVVSISVEPPPSQPTTLNLSAADAFTGQPVEATAYLAIRDEAGRWGPYQPALAQPELAIGRDALVLIQADGYYPQRLDFAAEGRPATVRAHALLVPESGTLVVAGEVGRLFMLLDGAGDYITGGPTPTVAQLPPIDPGETTVQLIPGDYELTIGVRGGSATTIPLRIARDQSTRVRVVPEGEAFGLTIEQVR